MKPKTLKYIKYFINYVPWAAIQQCLVILPFYFFIDYKSNGLLLWICLSNSILIFSFVFHLGNSKLTMLTLIFSMLTYPLIFNISIYFVIPVILIHAIAGAYLKTNGYEMRVWRFK